MGSNDHRKQAGWDLDEPRSRFADGRSAGRLRELAEAARAEQVPAVQPERPFPQPPPVEQGPLPAVPKPGGCCGGGGGNPYRAQHPLAMLARGIAQVAGRVDGMVKSGLPVDQVVLSLLLSALWIVYVAPTSFVRAHWLAWVGRAEHDRRAAVCAACPEREHRPRLGLYCKGAKCYCPQARWWPFARLTYRQWLRAWRCPIGAWRREVNDNG